MFRIQIFHPESGLYLNTNHESQDLEKLKSLLQTNAFAGPRFQIVDEDDNIHFGPVARDRTGHPSVEELAQAFGVPIAEPLDLGSFDDDGDD